MFVVWWSDKAKNQIILMKAIVQRERIRVIPVPKVEGYQLWVWLKKPLNEGSKPFVHADVVPGRKFYDLPCPLENINGVTIKLK